MFELRCDLLKQLEPFSRQSIVQLNKTCSVTPWPVQTIDVSGTDRIYALSEYNGKDTGRLLQGGRSGAKTGQNDLGIEGDQFSRIPEQTCTVTHAPVIFDT